MAKKLKFSKLILAFIAFVVGMCSIIYELLISTISSYLMGDSIRQFSIIIGIYLASMGIGSFFSRWISKKVVSSFIIIELLLGFVGAISVPLCYFYYSYSDAEGYQFFVLFLTAIIGSLTGFEIPLLTRIMEGDFSLKDNISNVLTFDYLGALLATLLFPFLLVPFVGLFKSSLIFGLINIGMGVFSIILLKDELIREKRFKKIIAFTAIIIGSIILGMLWKANSLMQFWNDSIFRYPIIHTENSPYQNITVTSHPEEFRLYLNGAIQFSSRDEYRYHEALVHIPLSQIDSVKNVLVLGGGEGLAAREILKYKELEKLTIVDIDPAISRLSKNLPLFKELNNNALVHPKVNVIHDDAFQFLSHTTERYDAIVLDLPDPTSEAIARLYSAVFFNMVLQRLEKDGIAVTQATSPELTKNAFWCINETMKESGFSYTYPYRVNVPSFGNWGFIMAKGNPFLKDYLRTDIDYKFLEDDILDHVFYFPKDIRVEDSEVNHLDAPILLEYYLDHWRSLQGQKR